MAAGLLLGACSKQDEPVNAGEPASAAKALASPPTVSAAETERLQADNAKLQSEVLALRKQIEDLSLTPAVLLARVTEALGAERVADARQASGVLEKRFSDSSQAKTARAVLAKFDAAIAAREAQAKALEARGFYALQPQNALTTSGVTLRVESLQLGGRWQFNAYDDQWHYRDAERGERFVLLRTTVQSVDKSPKLPGVAVYRIDGKKMTLLAQMSYEFRQWTSYGTFIGLYHDFKNDFAHTQSVSFNAAATISDEDAKKPIAVVATGQTCHERGSRIGQPEVVYQGYGCTPKRELDVEDFSKGGFRVLSYFNRPKGA